MKKQSYVYVLSHGLKEETSKDGVKLKPINQKIRIKNISSVKNEIELTLTMSEEEYLHIDIYI